ncbi:hypothetical protein GCM10011482_19400 [Enterococcus alcedinis]|uniref:Uncharacterized protein n=1 Tax=Enterococcus alcedinis TaxID=1274384 RepID=A0A917JGF4_9ENTE|nr:hypothetical protein GCM10011482_19400 [Enterococcus alcedinis]
MSCLKKKKKQLQNSQVLLAFNARDGQMDGPLTFQTQKIGDNSKEIFFQSYRLCALNVDVSI